MKKLKEAAPLLAVVAAVVAITIVNENARGIVLFAVLTLFSIGLHEFGHFLTAKKFGIKVEQFFIGFGPKLWSFRRGETEYGVKAIPAGGFVRIAGMNPLEEIAEEDRARVFKAAKPWKRAIVLSAGSFTHFLLAIVILVGLFSIAGVQDQDHPTTTVARIEPSIGGAVSPAAQAGISPGDRIVAINGQTITAWTQAQEIIRAHPNQTIEIRIQRGRVERTATAPLVSTKLNGKTVGLLGISTKLPVKRYNPVVAVGMAGKTLGQGIVGSAEGFGKLFSPSSLSRIFKQATQNEPRRVTDPTTVVGLARQAGGLASAGRFADLAWILALMNVFIGVANLMPLPPLDGGHLAVLAYEKIRKRDVDMQRLVPLSAAVISVLGTLFLVLLYLDIVKPAPGFPG